MAAPDIDAILQTMSEAWSDEVYHNNLNTSIWFDLVDKEEFPEGVGDTLSTLIYDQSLPANSLTWTTVTESSGSAGGACLPPSQTLDITKTTRTAQIAATALESPSFCTKDLKMAFKAEQQLQAIKQIMMDNSQWALKNRHRELYVDNCSNKGIVLTTGIAYDTSWASTEPTSVLTGGFLDRVYISLTRKAGARKNNAGLLDGLPTYIASVSAEQLERIKVESGYRDDLRYSNRVPELLKPLGASVYYKGFWLVADDFPRRFNRSGGNWVEVAPKTWSGGKLIDNPAYDTASYEETVIYHPDVIKVMVERPDRSYGDAKFNPTQYGGQWKWLNIPHATENPDGNIGKFRAVFSNGARAIFPQFGYALRHLRCSIPTNAGSCSST